MNHFAVRYHQKFPEFTTEIDALIAQINPDLINALDQIANRINDHFTAGTLTRECIIFCLAEINKIVHKGIVPDWVSIPQRVQ